MKWHLIEYGVQTGKENMDIDISLARSCGQDEAFFRLYGWNPYCISLGANQKFEDIDTERTSKESIDIVRRPTGGRAILHAEEITYSVIIPYSHELTPKKIYKAVSLALIEGLKLYDPVFGELSLEDENPHFPSLLQQPEGVLCFGSAAKNEIKFRGKKIVGSAQRKMDKVILQHGSILCGRFHRRLPEFVAVDDSTRRSLSKEMDDKTIEIEAITNTKTDYGRLSECLKEGFSKFWEINFESVKNSKSAFSFQQS
jgi:lipoate-protein ligase A